MPSDILERILKDTLVPYLLLDDNEIIKHLEEPALAAKQRVRTIDDIEVHIYSNDHLPPHFHVKTKDLKVDAKFSIEECKLLKGDVSSKDLKKIEAFSQSPKGKIALNTIWKKFHS
ncbi:DUF4160 domain-containing protein [Mucilaginibacter sp.]